MTDSGGSLHQEQRHHHNCNHQQHQQQPQIQSHARSSGPLPHRAKSSILPNIDSTGLGKLNGERNGSRFSRRRNGQTERTTPDVPDRVRSAPPIKTKKLDAAGDEPLLPLELSSGTFLLRPSVSEDRPLGHAYTPAERKPRQLARERSIAAADARSSGLDLSQPAVLQIKIRILGASGVGKSTFLRFVTDANALLSSDAATFAVGDCLCKVKFCEILLKDPESTKAESLEWDDDDSGERTDGRGTVVMYDVMCLESLRSVPQALNALRELNETVVLVAAKCDNPPASRVIEPAVVTQKARSVLRNVESFETALFETESPGHAIRSLLSKIVSRRRRDAGTSSADTLEENNQRLSSPPLSPSRISRGNTSPRGLVPSRGLPYRPIDDMPKVPSRIGSIYPPTAGHPSRNLHKIPPLQTDRRFSHSFLILGESPTSETPVSPFNDASPNDRTRLLRSEKPATFEELVARLLRPVPDDSDEDFVLNFLAFYRLFAAPSKLLITIISHFNSVQENAVLPWEHATLVERDLNVIDLWITQYPGDFAKPRTRKLLQEFLNHISPDTTAHEGEPVMNSGGYYGSSSEDEDVGAVAAVVQQIRLALQSVVEDEDTEWACSDGGSVKRSRTNTFLSISSIDSLEPNSSFNSSRNQFHLAKLNAAHDNKVIFGGQATVTLAAIGRGPMVDGLAQSANASSSLLNIAESAHRQGWLLAPTPRRNLDKDIWRAFLQHSDELVARELTRIDWILFSAVRPRDLIRNVTKKAAASSGEAPSTSEDDSHDTVVRMIEHFNYLAYWVTNLILFREKPKHRAQMLEKLMRVARRLRSLNNYYALSAFIAAILSPPVSRLGITKELVDPDVQKKFASLAILMSTSRSHWAYRFALETTEKAGSPRIPFLPLHRRDLVVVENTGKTFLPLEQPMPFSPILSMPQPSSIGPSDNDITPKVEQGPFRPLSSRGQSNTYERDNRDAYSDDTEYDTDDNEEEDGDNNNGEARMKNSRPSSPITSSRKSSLTLGSTLTSFTSAHSSYRSYATPATAVSTYSYVDSSQPPLLPPQFLPAAATKAKSNATPITSKDFSIAPSTTTKETTQFQHLTAEIGLGKGLLGQEESPKRINWPKFALLGTTLRLLQRAQACPYTGLVAQSNNEIRKMLLEVRICKDDDELYERSCFLEGSNAGVSAGTGNGIGGAGAGDSTIGSGSRDEFSNAGTGGGGSSSGVGKMREKIQGGLDRLKSR